LVHNMDGVYSIQTINLTKVFKKRKHKRLEDYRELYARDFGKRVFAFACFRRGLDTFQHPDILSNRFLCTKKWNFGKILEKLNKRNPKRGMLKTGA